MSDESVTANKATVSAFFEAMNSGDVPRIVAAYAEDGCLHTMGNTLISGVFPKAQIAAAAAGIYEVFPRGITFTVIDMVGDGDKVAVEASSDGEHVSGQTYSNEYHFLFQLENGKIKRLKEYMDTERVTDVLCGGQRPPFES